MQTDCSESGKRPTTTLIQKKKNSRDVQFEGKAAGAVQIAEDPILL